jgi:hypothetical protein
MEVVRSNQRRVAMCLSHEIAGQDDYYIVALTQGLCYSRLGSKPIRYTSKLYLLKLPIFTRTPSQLLGKYSLNSEFFHSIDNDDVPSSGFRICIGSYVCLPFTRRQGLTPDREVYERHLADLSGKLDV